MERSSSQVDEIYKLQLMKLQKLLKHARFNRRLSGEYLNRPYLKISVLNSAHFEIKCQGIRSLVPIANDYKAFKAALVIAMDCDCQSVKFSGLKMHEQPQDDQRQEEFKYQQDDGLSRSGLIKKVAGITKGSPFLKFEQHGFNEDHYHQVSPDFSINIRNQVSDQHILKEVKSEEVEERFEEAEFKMEKLIVEKNELQQKYRKFIYNADQNHENLNKSATGYDQKEEFYDHLITRDEYKSLKFNKKSRIQSQNQRKEIQGKREEGESQKDFERKFIKNRVLDSPTIKQQSQNQSPSQNILFSCGAPDPVKPLKSLQKKEDQLINKKQN